MSERKPVMVMNFNQLTVNFYANESASDEIPKHDIILSTPDGVQMLTDSRELSMILSTTNHLYLIETSS